MKPNYMRSIIYPLVLLAGISACRHDAMATREITPERLAELGAQIYVNPENQSAILAEAGMTESAFRQHIENISINMDASSRYSKSFEQHLRNYHN